MRKTVRLIWILTYDKNFPEMYFSGKIQEIQGTAEGKGFDQQQLNRMIDASQGALQSIFDLQNTAAEGQVVDG